MPSLFVLAGPQVGQSFELGDGAVLGRAPECEAHLGDASVTRRHARLELHDGAWWIVDLGSKNGTHVNGLRLEPRSAASLADDDELELGKVPLRFRIEAAPAAPAPPAEPFDTGAPAPPAEPFVPAEADEPFELPAMDRSALAARTEWTERASRVAEPAPPFEEPEGDDVLLEDVEELAPEEPEAPPRGAASEPAAPERSAIDERAILLRDLERGRGGLLGGDLAQRPTWQRALLVGLVLALSAGAFWGAFQLARFLRASS